MPHVDTRTLRVGRPRHTLTSGSVLALLTAAFLSAGCASSRSATPAVVAPIVPLLVVPAGVDSSVALWADSIAKSSFVPMDSQQRSADLQREGQELLREGDSLWLAFSRQREAGASVSAVDSAKARDVATTGGQALVALDRLLRDQKLEADAVTARTAALLDSAERALEAAFTINPFDPRSRLWLAQVYALQARRLGQVTAYASAIDVLEKLAALTPDEHAVFAMLANTHFRAGQWDQSARSYAEAERVYLETYDLVADARAVPDSSLLHSYARAEGDMRVRVRDAAGAERAFDRALSYATAAEDSAYVRGELEWMAWDGGNIGSAVTRDSLAELERTGDLAGAASGYQLLLTRLTTPHATDEIDWRLATVEYNLGREEAAAERLRVLAGRIPKDSAGAPTDRRNERYLSDYGSVCLNLGRRILRERRDNRTALKYFEQASRVAWAGRAAAFLEIATLVEANIQLSLENAGRAFAEEKDLTVEQRRTLYRLMMGLNRRAGDFDEARRFRDALVALEGIGR